jgi:hypothetical protein
MGRLVGFGICDPERKGDHLLLYSLCYGSA